MTVCANAQLNYIGFKINAKEKKGEEKNESKSATKAPKPTYHKSKNGRYYRKTTLASGKCQCRFVTAKEAEGGLSGSGSPPKKKRISKKQPEPSKLDT